MTQLKFLASEDFFLCCKIVAVKSRQELSANKLTTQVKLLPWLIVFYWALECPQTLTNYRRQFRSFLSFHPIVKDVVCLEFEPVISGF